MRVNYVLSMTKPRKETVDTLILFESSNRSTLEEILLSIWEEAWYYYFLEEFVLCKNGDAKYCRRVARRRALTYTEDFHITPVPYFQD